jgi:hypothetical protein
MHNLHDLRVQGVDYELDVPTKDQKTLSLSTNRSSNGSVSPTACFKPLNTEALCTMAPEI